MMANTQILVISIFFFCSVIISKNNATSGKPASHELKYTVINEVRPNRIIPAQEFESSRPKLLLDGYWDFSYDPDSIGMKEKWYSGRKKLPERTKVPGCNQSEYHRSAGNTKPSGDLKYPCNAPAWHKREFLVPEEWTGKQIWLHLGGIKPAAEIWCNGNKIGYTITSRSPVRCEITDYIKFGAKNNIVIRIFWPPLPEPRLDGIFDYVAQWTGIYRSTWIEAVAPIHFDWIHVIPAINPERARVNFNISGNPAARRNLRIICHIEGLNDNLRLSQELPVEKLKDMNGISMEFDMSDARLWHPGSPSLYKASLSLSEEDKTTDMASVRFGLREIKTQGQKIILNGKPVFLRGGCDDQIYPETICPPASKDFYKERIKKAKKYGFNYTKSCIDIFVQEFFDAADEEGYMVCQEMPFGLTGDYRFIYRNTPTPEFAAMYKQELANIVRSDRNHPSLITYSMASELNLEEMNDSAFNLFCVELPDLARKLNPSAMVIDITTAFNRYSISTPRGIRHTDIIEELSDWRDGQQVMDPLYYDLKGDWKGGGWQNLTTPFILHEWDWWTSLPDPSLIPRYIDLPLRQRGAPEMVELARKKGFEEQLPCFVRNSLKLKRLLVKEGLEMPRRHRHPLISGYHFWLIADFPWCAEGVFNEFFDEPEDLTAEEFRTYNNDIVLLLDDYNRRCFESEERTALGIELSHFGSRDLLKPLISWKLLRSGEIMAEGKKELEPVQCGTLTTPYFMNLKLPEGTEPVKYELLATLHDAGQEICYNHWNIWAYPKARQSNWCKDIATNLAFLKEKYPEITLLTDTLSTSIPSGKILVTNMMNEQMLDFLSNGGKIVLFSDSVLKEFKPGLEYAPGKIVRKHSRGRDFARLYCSPAYNSGEGNMGTVIKNHPALEKFPNDGWCDLNFLYLIHGIYPISLEFLYPTRIDPIIRSIGMQTTLVDKAYIFEVKVGKGSLLATSFNIIPTYITHPETRYLVECLLEYVAGGKFKPESVITKAQLINAIY